MPDLNHLWQRFLLASSLLVGLAIGVTATVFGYSNLNTVNVRWSVFHLDGVPLWTVAVVPIALILVAGTIYHWMDGLHHFTEHHRHRRRVHELEVEVATLRAHLDQVLEMPGHSEPALEAKRAAKASLPAADLAETDLAMAGLEVVETEPKHAETKPAEPKPAPPKQAEPKPPAAEVAAAASKPARDRRKRERIGLEPETKSQTEPAAAHPNGTESEPALAAPKVEEA